MIEMVETFNTGKTKNIFECAAQKSKMYVQTNTNVVMCQSKLDYVREQLNFFFQKHILMNKLSRTYYPGHIIDFFYYPMFRL